MKIQYRPRGDAVYHRLTEGGIVDSKEVGPGVILNFDANGLVVAIEMLDTPNRMGKAIRGRSEPRYAGIRSFIAGASDVRSGLTDSPTPSR